MTCGSLGTLVWLPLSALLVRDDTSPMVGVVEREGDQKMVSETNERQQRLKRTRKWPKWLRAPFLLRWAIRIGVLAYRLWNILSGDPGS